jgi:hypothetical protein
MNDKEYGDKTLVEFNGLLHQLNDAVAKVNRGEGTAGKLISDPSVYESVNDILIGINESKLLRWLIRNRQQSGIQKRYDTESGKAPVPPPQPVVKPVPKSEAPAPEVPPVAPATSTTTTTTTTTAPPM